MKKIIFILSFVLVSTVGFSQKESLRNSHNNNLTEIDVDKDSEIRLNYTFNNVESLKAFNTEKIGEINYKPYYSISDNGKNCEVTGSISITVSGSMGSSLIGGELEASVTVTLSVTASCSEIAGALKELAATAKSIALAQLMM